jgi:hypothetical protein
MEHHIGHPEERTTLVALETYRRRDDRTAEAVLRQPVLHGVVQSCQVQRTIAAVVASHVDRLP